MKKNSCAFKIYLLLIGQDFDLSNEMQNLKKPGALKCKNNAIQYFHFDGYNLFVERATKNYLFP